MQPSQVNAAAKCVNCKVKMLSLFSHRFGPNIASSNSNPVNLLQQLVKPSNNAKVLQVYKLKQATVKAQQQILQVFINRNISKQEYHLKCMLQHSARCAKCF